MASWCTFLTLTWCTGLTKSISTAIFFHWTLMHVHQVWPMQLRPCQLCLRWHAPRIYARLAPMKYFMTRHRSNAREQLRLSRRGSPIWKPVRHTRSISRLAKSWRYQIITQWTMCSFLWPLVHKHCILFRTSHGLKWSDKVVKWIERREHEVLHCRRVFFIPQCCSEFFFWVTVSNLFIYKLKPV
jgi:hypothetical protein